ncbi:hypothetical protein Pyn_12138 [Prunus yedoensis var. nudiflora]|uniref:Uncharacterized protein n=1 Tax=Prunus yedoensis var. nudiflora TaxID=2094558 RepID=A0A314USH5_PRUYE|nr:hypothetical protein Pyn_12138 [Prunus yedoensis var. nudiflora]
MVFREFCFATSFQESSRFEKAYPQHHGGVSASGDQWRKEFLKDWQGINGWLQDPAGYLALIEEDN